MESKGKTLSLLKSLLTPKVLALLSIHQAILTHSEFGRPHGGSVSQGTLCTFNQKVIHSEWFTISNEVLPLQRPGTSPKWSSNCKLGIPVTPSGLIICFNGSQNSRKHFTYVAPEKKGSFDVNPEKTFISSHGLPMWG